MSILYLLTKRIQMRILQLVRHPQPYLGLVLIFLLYSFLSTKLLLIDPPVHPDETYFVDTARTLQSTGYIATTIYGDIGLGSSQIRSYHYPPLYPEIIRSWMIFSGQDIAKLRLLSVLAGALALLFANLVLFKLSSSWVFSLLGTAIFLLYGPFGLSSRIVRMEIFVVLCALIGLYGILHYSKSTLNHVLSWCSFAFLPLFHPLGLIWSSLLLIGAWFHLKLSIRDYLKFFLLPVLLGLIYWIFRYSDRLDLLLQQVIIQFQYKADRIAILTQLYETRPIWRMFVISFLFTSSLGFLAGLYYKRNRLAVLSIGAFLSFFVVWYGKEQWYLVYLLVPILFVLAELVSVKRLVYTIAVYLNIAVLLIGFSYQQVLTLQTSESYAMDYTLLLKQITNAIPDQKANIVIAAMPDPTIGLWQLGYTNVFAVPHVSPPGTMVKFVKQHEYLLVNYATNPEFRELLSKSEWQSTTIKQGIYELQLIELVSEK